MTGCVIDSRSVKADAVIGADSRDFDGGKPVNCRKGPVADTLGPLLGEMVGGSGSTGRRLTVRDLKTAPA
ncbi:hypothetical protein [Streptomyces sp. 2A115]|uniref:hypothetical protein n=1 Tax=Streptomyces sp. 2A115 TaxID=3457439 RepID=UPI003FD5CCED